MTSVQGLFDQQFGFRKLNSYDNVLKRLRCSRNEEFMGLFDLEDMDSPIFACKFAQKKGFNHLLALANEDGKLAIHDTDNKETRHGRQIHQNAIFDIAWLTDSFKLVTVSGDHTARLIDLNDGDIRMDQMFTGHTRSVKTVAVRKTDASTFATGSRDGAIRVWDIRSVHASNLIVGCDRTIANSHCKTTPTSSKKRVYSNVSAANSVTGLAFQDENTLISCGSGDGLIKVWDLRKTYTTAKREHVPRNIIPYCGNTTRNGFSNLIVDPSGLKLYANCLDNTIYCYNISTCDQTPVMEYKGHQNTSFYIKSTLSQDGKYLLSGSADQNAYIWNVENQEALYRLVGHTAEVTCVAWRENKEVVVTCSDDVHHKIWRIGHETLPENWKETGRGHAELISLTKTRNKRFFEVNENTPSQNKRFRFSNQKRVLDDPNFSDSKRSNRRLFDSTNQPSSSRCDDDSLAVILEHTATVFKTPKQSVLRPLEGTPPETFSPTTNLPNFVVDGSAPHLNYSPQKRSDRDWLTKMRVERSLVKEMQELASGGPSSPKVPKLENSPRSRPRRRPSRGSSPQTHILQFFRVTNNSIMKDSQCSPKSQLQMSSHSLQTTREQ